MDYDLEDRDDLITDETGVEAGKTKKDWKTM